MKENRSQLIGVRFTKEEKAIIRGIARNRKIPITEFIREAIFSHINNLKEGNPLEVHFFMKNFEEIINSTENITNCINDMKNEFNLFEIGKIKHNLRINGLVEPTNQSKTKSTIKNKSNL